MKITTTYTCEFCHHEHSFTQDTDDYTSLGNPVDGCYLVKENWHSSNRKYKEHFLCSTACLLGWTQTRISDVIKENERLFQSKPLGSIRLPAPPCYWKDEEEEFKFG